MPRASEIKFIASTSKDQILKLRCVRAAKSTPSVFGHLGEFFIKTCSGNSHRLFMFRHTAATEHEAHLMHDDAHGEKHEDHADPAPTPAPHQLSQITMEVSGASGKDGCKASGSQITLHGQPLGSEPLTLTEVTTDNAMVCVHFTAQAAMSSLTYITVSSEHEARGASCTHQLREKPMLFRHLGEVFIKVCDATSKNKETQVLAFRHTLSSKATEEATAIEKATAEEAHTTVRSGQDEPSDKEEAAVPFPVQYLEVTPRVDNGAKKVCRWSPPQRVRVVPQTLQQAISASPSVHSSSGALCLRVKREDESKELKYIIVTTKEEAEKASCTHILPKGTVRFEHLGPYFVKMCTGPTNRYFKFDHKYVDTTTTQFSLDI